jgi:hypothetical protein
VIKESALIAMSWVQSHARELGLRAPGEAAGDGGLPGLDGFGVGDGAGGGGGGLSETPPGMYAAAAAPLPAAAAAMTLGGDGTGGAAVKALGDGLMRGRSVHIHLPQAVPITTPLLIDSEAIQCLSCSRFVFCP